MLNIIQKRSCIGLTVLVALLSFSFITPSPAAAVRKCGQGANEVKTSIDIGCKNKGNPIVDMLFAFIRFLSFGIGLLIAGSMVFAGIQYITARGDPQAVAAAKNRIQASLLALMLFIFAYAILNYIVPGAVLK